MKKTSIAKSLILLASVAFVASCNKKEDNTDQLAALGKATITGRITARTVDTAGAPATQYAPAGTVIMAWIDTRDLVLQADGTAPYAKRYFTATSDAAGYYTLTIDVSQYKTANVQIEPNDFELGVTKKNIGGPNNGTLYSDRHVFHASSVPSISINNNQHTIQDINYN